MTKCLECGKPVEQTKGKREKKYCDDNCRAKFYVKKGKPKPKRVNLETYQKILKERDTYKDLLFECQERNNPLINAARGRDKTGINNDEFKNKADTGDKKVNTDNTPPKEETPVNKTEMTEYERKEALERIPILEYEIKHPQKSIYIKEERYIAIRKKELEELKSKL